MNALKEIRLAGFKSFADRTAIPLGDGITCIVGPNGCGKSNVVDAIRWVLGEQSSKRMRGTQMSDMIFDGTEKRKKMSFCEVTLVFDNSTRLFDIESEEVEMTRRLYRDGGSEYLLNRNPSKLKTLTSLLHGVGAAKEGYSIIGQGRVEEIMKYRPEERRAIFEEATGILSFKERKSEAERNLAASKENLDEFEREMRDVERRLNPLKKASESALEYESLSEELKIEEANLFVARSDGAAREIAEMEAKKSETDEAIAENESEAGKLLTEYETLRDGAKKRDDDLQDLNMRLNNYQVSMERKSGDARVYLERSKSVKAELDKASESIAYAEKRIAEIDKAVAREKKQEELSRERAKKQTEEAEGLKSRAAELSAKIAEHEREASEQRKKALDAVRDLAALQRNMGSMEAQKDLLQERLSEIERDRDGAESARAEKQREYDGLVKRSVEIEKILSSEDDAMERARAEAKKWEDEQKRAGDERTVVESEIASLNSRLETIVGIRDRYEGYSYATRNLLTAAKDDLVIKSKIRGTIADIVTCEKDCETAIETAFGGAMNDIVTPTREDARDLIDYLKRTRSGQVTFLPMDAMASRSDSPRLAGATREPGAVGTALELVKYDKAYSGVIGYLLGNTLVAKTLDDAVSISKRYPREFKIVTLAGDLIAASGSMTGGYRTKNADLLLTERNIKETEEEIKKRRARVETLKKRKEECDAKRTEADERVSKMESGFSEAHVENASIAERQSALLSAIASDEASVAGYDDAKKLLEERLAGLDSEYTGAASGAERLESLSDSSEAEESERGEQYARLVKERDDLSSKMNGLLLSAATLESSADAQAKTVSGLEEEKTRLLEDIAKSNASIPGIKEQMERLEALAEKEALSEDERAVVDDLKRQIEDAKAARDKANERIKEIDRLRLELSQKKDKLTEEAHAIDLARSKIESDLEALKVRIAEDYDLDYEGCLAFKKDDFDESLSSAEIASIRRKIATLGPINQNAVAEFEEVSTQYDEMVAKRDDLQKAIDDLAAAVNEIRDEMLAVFNKGFDAINENFQRIFKELFGGGEARLVVDYEHAEDPLEAGVEIMACPPGKKLSNIALLSGGETAMTSIAILFAIIATNPMPFSVLDEIDSALDDGNVARLANYLEKFAKSTQFIVITHKKRTMEAADVLLGVTMEEKGVSKMVSVKLSEVESKIGKEALQ